MQRRTQSTHLPATRANIVIGESSSTYTPLTTAIGDSVVLDPISSGWLLVDKIGLVVGDPLLESKVVDWLPVDEIGPAVGDPLLGLEVVDWLLIDEIGAVVGDSMLD